MTPYPYRNDGYKLLNGHGLEIGAFHQPAPLPAHCTIEYCDVCSPEEIIKHFPELNISAKALVKVDYICDLDKQGLSIFSPEQFDFVILNHVIEHVANPINIVGELFRITKPGGYVVISAPDKRFTFDHARPLTPFEHLLEEYQNNVTEVTEEHYLDFLRGVHPETSQLSPAEFQGALNGVKQRREHVHVWHSKSFTEFMQKSLELLNVKAECVFLNRGAKNHFEYFSVWRKKTDKPNNLDKSSFIKKWWRRVRHRR
jgi:SAM-dependent methyltransferase